MGHRETSELGAAPESDIFRYCGTQPSANRTHALQLIALYRNEQFTIEPVTCRRVKCYENSGLYVSYLSTELQKLSNTDIDM
jgi:hypothetical protein